MPVPESVEGRFLSLSKDKLVVQLQLIFSHISKTHFIINFTSKSISLSAMNRSITYSFHPVEKCNMCGSGAEHHRILGKRLNASQGRHPGRKTGITTTIMRCRKCGLIFSNPIPVPLDIQDHYGVTAEDYWQEDYLKTQAGAYTNELQHIKEILNTKEQIVSLDIGAGFGAYMMACKNAGFDAYGCEPSESFYRRAIETMSLSPDHLIKCTVEELKWPDEKFHFIFMGAVLEHLTNPAQRLTDCMKWLKPGGILSVIVPSSDWLSVKLFDWSYKLRGLGYTAHLSPMHSPYHLYEFTLDSFKAQASNAGYTVHSCHYEMCQTFLPGFLSFLLRPYMRRFNKGMEINILLQKT